jgi:hypothetical protein
MTLRAGPLDLLFEQGELRSIRLGDREVISRIYVAVRDRNWDTAPPALSKILHEVGEASFRISFDVSCRLREIDFTWKGLITGDSSGTLTFSMDGEARSTFMRNRIGFCILHPDSCAGARCTLRRPDGSLVQSEFPRAISPHQPFMELSGISHEISPGTWADLFFEGDVFETEDQRNWTDASFKTYCTPLKKPFPVQVASGTEVRQAVTLRLRAESGTAANQGPASALPGAEEAVFEIESGAPVGPLPRIGLCAASHGGTLSARGMSLLAALNLDHLRVDLDLSASGWKESLRRASAEAAALAAHLLVALHLSDSAEDEIAALGGVLGHVRSAVDLWLVFKKGEACTADRWAELARKALGPFFPNAEFASGTNAYFAELNRGTPPGRVVDCLVYSVNPQIHAFDDISVMETLSAQAATVESARRISGDRPIVVSPVTLKARFNAVATGPLPPVQPGELPPQVDPRQMSLFGAAWTVGSIASLARAGAARLSYYETTGWRGVMESEQGPPVPECFPALPGCVFPLYHALADIGEMKGGVVLSGSASPAPLLAGLTIDTRGGRRTMIANLGPSSINARVIRAPGSGRRARVRVLDETNVERACRSPVEFRTGTGARMGRGGELKIVLLPYAVARIDWEV